MLTIAPEVSFRPFDAADREGCLAVFDSNTPQFFAAGERAQFAAFLDAVATPYFVLRSHGIVVGCGGYRIERETRVARLTWGMIHRDRQRRGLGRALLKCRIALIRRSNAADRVDASTSQRSRAFFEKAGFEVTANIADGHAPGIDRADCSLALIAAHDAGSARER